jgi:hypothetical protein
MWRGYGELDSRLIKVMAFPAMSVRGSRPRGIP